MATKIRGITIELSADATGVLEAVKSVNSEITATGKQLKDVDRLLKLDPGNTDLLKQKTQLLNEQIENTKTKLDELKKAQEDMKANGVDENSAQYQALQREIIATEQELKKLEQTAGSGSATLAKIGQVTGEIGDKMEAAGKKLSYVSAAIAALGAASLAAFEEVDEGADIVIKKTGATGEAADALEESYKNVAGSIVGDFADIGTAVGEVNTRFGVTGEDLEDLSTLFLEFADINDTDVNAAVDGVDRALKTFNVDQSQAKNVMGLLSATAQKTGISMDDMLSLLQSSGPTLKEMGLDIGSAVTLMGNFEAAGLDSGEMLGKLQKAATYYNSQGLDMNEGLASLITRLQDSSTAADATAEAYEIFGKRGGLAFITAAQEGKISIDDLTTSLDDYGSVVDDTYQQTLDGTDAMKLAWQNMQLGLSELGSAIGETLAPIMEKITSGIQSVVEWFTSLDDSTRETIVTIGLIVAAIGPLLVIGGKVMNGISSISTALSKLGSVSFGPIGIVITAIAALTAAGVALLDSWKNSYIDASAFAESLEAVKEKNDELNTSISNTKSNYENSVEASEAQAVLAETLATKLDGLIQAYDGSAEKQAEIQLLVDQLNQTVPGLCLAWDEVTNSLNLSTQEIYAQIKAMEAQARVTALTELYTESIKQQYEAQKNVNDAWSDLSGVLNEAGISAEDFGMMVGKLETGTWTLGDSFDFLAQHGINSGGVMEMLTTAYNNCKDAQDNLDEATENVAYAEGELANAMTDAAIAANASTQAIKDKYLQVFGVDMPDVLQNAIDAAQDAGVKIPQNIIDGLMAGEIGVDDAATQITEAMNKEVEARQQGQKIGVAYPESAAASIRKNGAPIGSAASEVMAELDLSEETYDYGSGAIVSWASGAENEKETARLATKVITDEVVDGVSGLPAEMNAYGSSAGAELDSGFGGHSGSISTTVDDIWNIYYNALGVSLPAQAWNWGYTAMSKFKSGMDNYTSIPTTVSGIVTTIETTLGQLKWKLQSAGYMAMLNFNNGMVNYTTYLYSHLQNIATAIQNYFNLQNALYSAGYYAGMGFNNGFVATAGTIYANARTMAANVASIVRSALKISSPSKVMTQLGEYTGEGFEIGLENSAQGIYSVIGQISDAVTNIEGPDISMTGSNLMNAQAMQQNRAMQAAQTAQEQSANLSAMMGLLNEYLPYLAEQTNIVLDDGTLAGHMAPAMNEALGAYQERVARG